MTEEEAQQVFTLIVTAFPSAMQKLNAEQQRATARLYRRFLLDVDSGAATAAVERIIATHRFPSLLPTVAEIREAALATTAGDKQHGLRAWQEVKQAVGVFGRDRFPVFDDPLTAVVVEALGWRDYCNSDVDDEPSWRARFAELYDKLATDERRDQIVRSLPAVKRYRELKSAAAPLSRALALIGSEADDGGEAA